MAILPTPYTHIIDRPEPRFRKRDSLVNRTPSQQEYLRHVEALWKLILQHVGFSSKRWSNLLEHIERVKGHSLFTQVVSVFKQSLEYLEGDVESLWEDGILLIRKHKKFPDTPWAFSQSERDQLELLIQRIQPSDPRKLYHLLFTHYALDLDDVPYVEGSSNYDFQVTNQRIQSMDNRILSHRQIAIEHLMVELNNEEFVAYVLSLLEEESSALENLVPALSLIINPHEKRHLELLEVFLNHNNKRLQHFATNIILTIIRNKGKEYVLNWANLLTSKLSLEAI